MIRILELLTSEDPEVRNLDLATLVTDLPLEDLLSECLTLDQFRRSETNLYIKVRALFFLHAIYRYHLPVCKGFPSEGRIPYAAVSTLRERRFGEAIDHLLLAVNSDGINAPLASALAEVYQRLAFQNLADQVRISVRSVRGNQWMFRLGHPLDQPLRLKPVLSQKNEHGLFPILKEQTPVRMDLTHSGWSDIFFLGMDYPSGARVLNISVDLAVRGQGSAPKAPVEVYLRIIDEPVLRLVSVDLGAKTDIQTLSEVYDFNRDYLGLLKAAVIAAGLIPPGMEGSGASLQDVLAQMTGSGHGLELVSHVNDIPKGSRLAVSTNLLAGLIAVCMRATGQTASLIGPLTADEQRTVASRAILGEWLGGSGGGWQDSGGVWPGIKLIEGAEAEPGQPEYMISQGQLLPTHRILNREDVPEASRQRLQQSLIPVHGGMAQNVGPILEMVTEKYLLRSGGEWAARQEALSLLDDILEALKEGDIRRLGKITTHNFRGPLQTIIPWATNFYTERLISDMEDRFGDQFWGFWMLGGMAGGGMGFIVDPTVRSEAEKVLLESMTRWKERLQHALPFAMDPVVYEFRINETGTTAHLMEGDMARMPVPYYGKMLPEWVREDPRLLSDARKAELELITRVSHRVPEFGDLIPGLFDSLLPQSPTSGATQQLQDFLKEIGADPLQQEEVRSKLQAGQLGLAQNRLPATTLIEDVEKDEITVLKAVTAKEAQSGMDALSRGEVAVVTLAAGTGSRWTQGAGVVKGLHPFCRIGDRHRSFLELHLAKSRKTAEEAGCTIPHVFTTSYLTDGPIRNTLEDTDNYGYPGPVYLSKGSAVGVRMIPMLRDLVFAWEELPQQLLDEQAQKMRESLHTALMNWAESAGEGTDYTDNVPEQCLHPVGHWFEIPNLFRNGVLADMLEKQPQVKWLLLHNIDTTGAYLNPAALGHHIHSGNTLTFEVIPREIHDTGGGLGKVNGKLQMVEGLALPSDDLEVKMRFYNSNTTWIDVDRLLECFNLKREELRNIPKVTDAIRSLGARLPTYITLKEVKKRWGHGQEDVFPVSQYEKLWTDMTRLPECACGFLQVDRLRGQQLKDPAQLDSWERDGSLQAVADLCTFE